MSWLAIETSNEVYSSAARSARFVIIGIAILLAHQPAIALDVFDETDADVLAAALFPGTDGLIYTPGNAVLQGQFDLLPNASSTGTFTNTTGTYGIGNGSGTLPEEIVLSTGLANAYADGPNLDSGNTHNFSSTASAAQDALLTPITNQFAHFDATQLDISFDNTTGAAVPFDLFAVFGSEEFPDFVNTSFNDGFGASLNGTNIAFANGSPLNVDHPNFAPIQGTELNGIVALLNGGILDPRLMLTGIAQPGQNNLTLIIGDASDNVLDTTVYLSRNTIAGPIPGTPVFPDSIDPITGGFVFDDIDLTGGDTIFLDPDVAVGYEYQATGSAATPNPKFASVLVNPTQTDTEFLISFGSQVDQLLTAGMVFDLTILEPNGVDSFIITDIDTGSLLDPTNTLAFITGVTFTTDVTGIYVTQTPLTIFIPEPASALLMASLALIATTRTRTRRFLIG